MDIMEIVKTKYRLGHKSLDTSNYKRMYFTKHLYACQSTDSVDLLIFFLPMELQHIPSSGNLITKNVWDSIISHVDSKCKLKPTILLKFY